MSFSAWLVMSCTRSAKKRQLVYEVSARIHDMAEQGTNPHKIPRTHHDEDHR
jgi:hypothetical protein